MEANDVLPLVTVEIDFNKQVLLILLIEFQSSEVFIDRNDQ